MWQVISHTHDIRRSSVIYMKSRGKTSVYKWQKGAIDTCIIQNIEEEVQALNEFKMKQLHPDGHKKSQTSTMSWRRKQHSTSMNVCS